MKKFIVAALMCLTLTAGAFAQDLSIYDTTISQDEGALIIIEGPTNAEIGDLVVLSVEKSNGVAFKWLVSPETKNVLVIDGGKRIVFSSGVEGTFTFHVATAKADTVDMVVHTVVIKANGPEPTPTPPQPEPTPESTMTKVLKALVAGVDSDIKKSEVLEMARNFETVSMAIANGTLETPAEVVAATAELNKKSLGDNLVIWSSFREGLSDQLKTMASDGVLSDTVSHKTVWDEIAASLREVAHTL